MGYLFTHHQHPAVPKELRTIYFLSGRMALSSSMKRQFYRLKRGYLGELTFHNFLKMHQLRKPISLYSLFLEHDGAFFQLDHVNIVSNTIYIHEIKYFSGTYIFENNRFISRASQREINNPFIQLKRAESHVRQIVQNLGIRFQVVANVIFMHDEFTLFQANPQLPLILRPQLRRYLSKNYQHNNNTKNEMKLAKRLVSLHQNKNPFERPFNYDFDTLNKGVNCPQCMGMMDRETSRMIACMKCQFTMSNKQALLFNLNQLKHLFPHKKIKTSLVSEWCGGLFSYYIIRNTIKKHWLQ